MNECRGARQRTVWWPLAQMPFPEYAMLSPEAAGKQLERWTVESNEDRWIAQVRKLPVKQRPIALALLGRDAEGREFGWQHWAERKAFQRQQARVLEALARKDRVGVFRLFFPKMPEAMELTWQFLKAAPYTTGYERKSFRAPGQPEVTLGQRVDWLESMVSVARGLQADVLTPSWLAAWGPHLEGRSGLPGDTIGPLLAASIDAGGREGEEVFEILCQSARNEHEIGAMGRHVTRGLLSASRAEGWQLVEKLLLAAQRQEGLRQVILEMVDEAHPEAFRRMLRLIRDEKLARFSAVARAADVWFGVGWDSASVTVINDTISTALLLLESEAERRKALDGKDAERIFLALWAMAFEDAPATIPVASKLLCHARAEVRFVAVTHLRNVALPAARAACISALNDEDLRVALCALRSIGAPEDEEEEAAGSTDGVLFETLERLYQRMPERPQELQPLVWPWARQQARRDHVAQLMVVSLGKVPPTRLIPYLRAFGPYQRAQVAQLLSTQKKWDELTRETLLDLAGDASPDVRGAALEALGRAKLTAADAVRLEQYLTRKASDIRRGILSLLLAQDDVDALPSADRLLASRDRNQRLAGLELLRHLAEAGRQRARCIERAENWRAEHRRVTAEEQTQLAAIRDSDREIIGLENALGLMDPAERTPANKPRKHSVACITSAAIKLLQSLDELVHAHRETPVPLERWDGQVTEELLGTVQHGFPVPDATKPLAEQMQKLPLREVWEQWFEQRPAATRDADGLEALRALVWLEVCDDWDWEQFREWLDGSPARKPIAQLVRGGQKRLKLRYPGVVQSVLRWLAASHLPAAATDFALDVVETLCALVPQPDLENLRRKQEDDDSGEEDWRDAKPFEVWLQAVGSLMEDSSRRPTAEQIIRKWQLLRWLDEPIAGAVRQRPGINVILDAYRERGATGADIADHLLGPRGSGWSGASFDSLEQFTQARLSAESRRVLEELPAVGELVDRARSRILEIELARGEAETAATGPALSLESLYGAETLIRLLSALGKSGFKVESSWRGDRRMGRAATLTHLVSITYPNPQETPADFAGIVGRAINEDAFPQERLLELVFLAPQWGGHIESTLDWEGLTEALYWFLAHMHYVWGRTTQVTFGADEPEPEEDEPVSGEEPRKLSAWERLIAERTPLSDEERSAGAVDVAWFHRTYQQLTPKRWQALTEAAKFAANSAQARRAQFIADVLLGRAKRKELISAIRQKKLKEHVRLLGLLPLASGAQRDADVAERYQVLQDYGRYARQLSAMTKEGALRACEIGLQNLARTAGYPDPLRLQWAMEASSTRDLRSGPVSVSRGDLTMTLALDEQARPQLAVRRGDKPLKSLPVSHKKEKRFIELSERCKELKRQASRVKQSLEAAMCRGDEFSGAELMQLSEHALLAPLLERLVLVGEGIMGYPVRSGKALRDHAGRLEPVKKKERLRIAHPHDLLESGAWDQWQHECFQSERLQPFKQVFRELYVATRQEKSDGTISRRYAGQQVNPRQAYALWGQRGWKVDDGVWRTFHDLGLTASVSFNFGITTPLEVEGLTLEGVQFTRRGEFKPLKLTDVPPRVFSEVMRDVDLVVSVAHRGGVDPEASASTVEMRAALLRETCSLLGLENVRIKNAHAIIGGKLGQYSVHLGSATVHRLPGGAVCIVPVHAQHRGRLFLPFADDDPRTAEVITKVLLLARDTEIQDPTILEQLRALA